MGLTVVIPTTLQRRCVLTCLESVIMSAQRIPESEVLLVVNGPGVRQPELRIDSPLLTVINCDRASASLARNIGMDRAKNSVVLFVDDDCLVHQSWCTDLFEGLNCSDTAVVAAPVCVDVLGPVTSFLNYQRFFDAPPKNSEYTHYPVTANCGIRKDILRGQVQFDASNFVASGGDTEFGYSLQDHGFNIRWLNTVQPARHLLSEHIDEITERFVSYGQAAARLFYTVGRWSEFVPQALNQFKSIAQGQYKEYRRFGELTDSLAQRVFASFELMCQAAFLIGYLDELGIESGYQLISPDYGSLRVAWQKIANELTNTSASEIKRWSHLTVHIDQWSSQLKSGVFGQPSFQIAKCLHNNVSVTTQIPSEVERVLNSEKDQFVAMQQQQRQLLGEVIATRWKEMSVNVEALEQSLRSLGMFYPEGCHEIEKMIVFQSLEV